MSSLGRYRVGERLGQGGMAEVFRAEAVSETGVRRQVVIKRLRPELARVPEMAAMFTAEARLAERLSHGGIVQVFDDGVDAGVPYLVMELVDGVTLDELVAHLGATGARLPLAEALFVIGAVAEALAYAHRLRDPDGTPLGLLHRDVTPRNVLLSREGVVKLADFGIARVARPGSPAATMPGVIKGSIGYLSPEQARGDTLDARSDQFALGVLAWELVAGTNPLADATTLEEARALLDAGLPRLPGDDALADIVARATAAAREDRFPDVEAFGAALEEWRVTRKLRGSPARLAELVRRARGEDIAAPRAIEADVPPARATVAIAPAPARPRRRGVVVAAIVAVAAIAGAVGLAARRGEPVAERQVVPVPVPVAAVADAAPAVVAVAPSPPDAAPAPSPPAPSPAAPRRARPAAPTPAPPTPAATGRLKVNLLPWANVSLDGRALGHTPVDVTWPAGRYKLVLENPDSGRRRERTVDIPARGTAEVTSW